MRPHLFQSTGGNGTEGTRHLPLDGLRGIAIVSVVLFHTSHLPGGWIGVDVFFALSGYLITSILVREFEMSGRIGLAAFYERRLVRLVPAFLLMLLCITAIYLLMGRFGRRDMEDTLASALYVMNWNRAFGWISHPADLYLGHTWSLSTEEQFYLIWPFLLILLIRIRRWAPAVTIGLAVLSLAWRYHVMDHGGGLSRIYQAFDTHADSILLGCTLGLIGVSGRTARIANASVLVPAALIAAMWFLAGIDKETYVALAIAVAGACAVWFIAASHEKGILSAVLSWRPLVYTGRVSYGWYLWHFPLIRVGQIIHWHGNLIFVPLSYAIAALSFHWLEQPVRVWWSKWKVVYGRVLSA